jgi:hypothetical protein
MHATLQSTIGLCFYMSTVFEFKAFFNVTTPIKLWKTYALCKRLTES